MTVTEGEYSTDASVKVAVRIRPQNGKERMQMNRVCTSVPSNDPQIFIGKDKAFTYDHVFNMDSQQIDIFNILTKPLINGCLEGYNATILAYGQTGSGKTYTMGSGFELSLGNDEVGIIPRALQYLFKRINDIRYEFKEKQFPLPEFKIVAQFLELYNEELIDLLDSSDKNQKTHIKIHENTGGTIYLTGVSTRLVNSLDDTLKCLKDGTLCRSTASTNMNSQSSRSHAIFTLHIKQQRFIESDGNNKLRDDYENGESEFETLTAKFHFVDLAGSERLKRTGATGDRAKEGISINCGLLALGNVISILGDRTKKGQHVPYRNSKLTRLLQDSLGGNSQTIMIACISPSDCDFLETLNTLNYANRARNIKNKLSVNQDKTSKQLAVMRQQIDALQAELLEYKQGKRTSETEDGVRDLFSENGMLQNENQTLRFRIKALNNTIDSLKARNAQILAEKESFMWKIKKQGSNMDEIGLIDLESEEIMKVVDKYTKEVEELRAKLAESESMVSVLQKCSAAMQAATANSSWMGDSCHQHVSMSGEFPDVDESIFEFVASDTSFIQMNSSYHKRRKKKSTTEDNKQDAEFDMFESHQYNEGAGYNKDKNEIVIDSGAGDIDRDSLNGDDADDNVAEEDFEENDDQDQENEEGDEDDESDTDNQDAENYLHHSLATLSNEIDVKKRLIQELQSKQKQLQKIRLHYEQQLELLQHRIRETETERDKVLASLGEAEINNEERVRKVRSEYERKLQALTNELNQLQTAKREHTLMLKNQQRKDQELRQLQRELNELKTMKVQLSKKLREEAKRTREIETTRNREIVQLRKEKRLKEHQIRNLEQDKQRRDNILRRKQEEIESLRKRNQNIVNIRPLSNVSSTRSSYQSFKSRNTPTPTVSSSVQRLKNTGPVKRRPSVLATVTKDKLRSIETALQKIVSRRHTIASYENDMNTRVKEREKLCRKLQRLDHSRRDFIKKEKPVDQIMYEMKNIRAHIESVQEDITECQSNILELEEAKLEETNMSQLIGNCSLDEAQYLLDQLFQIAVARGFSAHSSEAQESTLRLELEARTQEREQALDMLRVALQHSTVPFDFDGIFVAGEGGSSSAEENEDELEDALDSNYYDGEDRTSDAAHTNFSKNFTSSQDMSESKKVTSKRKPATQEELLGVDKIRSVGKPSVIGLNLDNNNNSSSNFNRQNSVSLSAQTPTETSKGLVGNAFEVTSQLSLPMDNQQKMVVKLGSGGSALKSPNRKPLTWKHPGGSMTTSLIMSKSVSGGDDISGSTPPTSPNIFRRPISQKSIEDNVFKRLTNTRPTNPKKGVINAVNSKKTGSVSGNTSSLFCTHVAEGHHHAVLDMYLNGDLMITGSKDRTAKIWDLVKMVEIRTLTDHQTSVTKVRLVENVPHIAFTVSTYYVKMWDLRDSAHHHCVRTLWSSGLSQEGPPPIPSDQSNLVSSSTAQPAIYPPGENYIMDIAMAQSGSVMFLATANSVKLWDMRGGGKFSAVGKLHGNHQAPVMVLASADRDRNSTVLVTGSKDHFIKVFEVNPSSVGLITPNQELQPPHYDGVESLVLNDDASVLFSGSRDACIKRWDLTAASSTNLSNSCSGINISHAHRDWVQALSLFSSGKGQTLLASGCRSGVIKLWGASDCSYIGELQAHDQSITSLRSCNSSAARIMSSSNDGKVKIWRFSDTDIDSK